MTWLENKKWSASGISSGARYAHWVMAGFALVWNLITLPMFWQFDKIWREVQVEPVKLFIFLFPLIGVGLILAAVHAFAQWRRFGPSPLVLDPFPGAIGGQVGGSVDTRVAFRAGQRFDVSLSCLYSRVSGSGKNRSRSESVKWQADGVCHSQRSGLGTELSFRFDVPGDLPVADYPRSRNYHLWRVSISCELDGPDFNRSYEIPVFNTGARSAIPEGTETHAATVDAAMEGVESIADIQPVAGGIEAHFPAFQRPAQGFITIVFGLAFAAAGYFAGSQGAPLIFPLMFIPIGTFIAGYGVFYLGKSLRVVVTRDGVRSRRYLFSYPLTSRRVAKGEFKGFVIDQGASMQSGNKTTVYYRLYATRRGGKRFPVAERLTGRAEAELLQETFETYLSG